LRGFNAIRKWAGRICTSSLLLLLLLLHGWNCAASRAAPHLINGCGDSIDSFLDSQNMRA